MIGVYGHDVMWSLFMFVRVVVNFVFWTATLVIVDALVVTSLPRTHMWGISVNVFVYVESFVNSLYSNFRKTEITHTETY